MNAPGNSSFQLAAALSVGLHVAVLVLPGPAGASLTAGTSPAPRLSARLLAPPASAAPTPPARAPMPRLAAAQPPGVVTRPPAPALAAPSAVAAASATPLAASAPALTAEPTAAPAGPPAAGAPAITAAASRATDSEAAADVPPEHRADYLNNPKPNYPKFARDRGQQGRVLLAVHVGADGRPLTVRLERSSGFPLLDAAAQEAVERWRFVPARRGQTPVEAWAQVPIAFGLAQP